MKPSPSQRLARERNWKRGQVKGAIGLLQKFCNELRYTKVNGLAELEDALLRAVDLDWTRRKSLLK